MIRNLFSLLLLLTSAVCNQSFEKEKSLENKDVFNKIPMYSENVKDSFYIDVNLPADYTANKNKYPVVFLLDANLYFDIVATILDKYSEVGLAPSVILVGIGYKDFIAMDSLRNRDDTYPIAIPEYEMSVSGGLIIFYLL